MLGNDFLHKLKILVILSQNYLVSEYFFSVSPILSLTNQTIFTLFEIISFKQWRFSLTIEKKGIFFFGLPRDKNIKGSCFLGLDNFFN